ncbi:hypothetical protein QBC44DRAFT_383479 [Cladorrhinum sp. PSN332]|nr:hypothetical protein QBC44DRAFT_383479 [Cladorrhinum sp. PSN332]
MLGLNIFAIFSLAATSLAGETSNKNPGDIFIQARNLPGHSDADTLSAIHRRLAAHARDTKGTQFKTTGNIAKSWNSASLFMAEDDDGNPECQITCLTCYFKGSATFEMLVNKNLDVTNAIQNATQKLKDFFSQQDVGDATDQFRNGDDDSIPDFTMPTVGAIPGVELHLRLDELDLYLHLNTKMTLSDDGHGQLVLPLFKSPLPLGFEVPGVIMKTFITVDLLLGAVGSGAVDITNGMHFKITPPLGFKLGLFSSNVTEIQLKGAQFEFLPVTVKSQNVVLRGILRVGLSTGIELTSLPISGAVDFLFAGSTVSAGVQAGVLIDVADFATIVTSEAGELDSGEECNRMITEAYTLGVGATAGATLALGPATAGGRELFTVIPVFSTAVAEKCANTVFAPAPTATRAPRQRRQANRLTTAELEAEITHTYFECDPESTSLVHCAGAGRHPSEVTETILLTTVIPKGETPTFPAAVVSTVATTIPFGSSAHSIKPTSGAPKGFVAPDEESGGPNKVVIGVMVGLVMPLLLGLLVLGVFMMRRHKIKRANSKMQKQWMGNPYSSSGSEVGHH